MIARNGFCSGLLWACFLAAALASSAGRARGAAPDIEVFSREGCPRCADAKRFLSELAAERPSLRIEEHDVARDAVALARLRELAHTQRIGPVAVPTFVVGDEVIVGFESAATTGRALREALDHSRPGSRAIPVLGDIDVERLGLPLFTIVIGLVDGFNPCAMWVLLFILSLLVNLHDRARMALIGGTFVAVSGLVYFAFMAAWLEVFLFVGIDRGVQALLGVLAMLVGTVNVKDFFAYGRGVTLSIPAAAKPAIYARARRVLSAENLPGALAATVVLALLVNGVELLCTAGLPAVFTRILTLRELPTGEYYAYLALYNLAYVLDDALMLAIAVVTLSRRKLRESGGRALKLVSGLVLLVLGALLLLEPGSLA